MRVLGDAVGRALDAVAREPRALGDDLRERLAREHERGALVRGPAVAELAARRRGGGTSGGAAPRRRSAGTRSRPISPRPSLSAASAPRSNESVTDSANQQFMPALIPQSTIPACQASTSTRSRPCARQIGEQVRGVAAADVDDVLLEHERAQVGDPPLEEREVRRLAVARRERAVEVAHVGRRVAARGRDEADARRAVARASDSTKSSRSGVSGSIEKPPPPIATIRRRSTAATVVGRRADRSPDGAGSGPIRPQTPLLSWPGPWSPPPQPPPVGVPRPRRRGVFSSASDPRML